MNNAEYAVLPIIVRYAAKYQVCPALVLAVIQQESEFRSYVVGDRGKSFGLMQISYIAALDVGYTSSFQEWKKSGLEIETNIKYGVGYLELQHKRYGSAEVYDTAIENTLSAYNAGQPTLKNRRYVQQTLSGRTNRRGFYFYFEQLVKLGLIDFTNYTFPLPLKEEIEPLTYQQVVPLLPGEIIRRGSRSSKMVAITIDDGWNPRLVEKALLILREEGVKCTLFPIGSLMEKNPDLWQSALVDGHELGNHTYSHFSISGGSVENIHQEIQRWEQVVSSFGGEKTNFFRPPRMSGFTNPDDAAKYSAIIAEMGYITVLWSIDVYANIYKIHGTDVDPQIVVDYIVAKVRAGDIILLHFIRPDVTALSGIIRGIRAKGLEPVTLTTLLSSP